MSRIPLAVVAFLVVGTGTVLAFQSHLPIEHAAADLLETSTSAKSAVAARQPVSVDFIVSQCIADPAVAPTISDVQTVAQIDKGIQEWSGERISFPFPSPLPSFRNDDLTSIKDEVVGSSGKQVLISPSIVLLQ